MITFKASEPLGIGVCTLDDGTAGLSSVDKTSAAASIPIGARFVSIDEVSCAGMDKNKVMTALKSAKSSKSSLTLMFVLVFPGFTGVLAGSNFSGDLATPSRSILRGSLSSLLCVPSFSPPFPDAIARSRARARFSATLAT